MSLASNTQASKGLGLGLRPPEASSRLRALSTPAKLNYYVIASFCTAQRTDTPQHCRAVPAQGSQHFSSQQGSSDAPGRQVAAKRHQKPPGNGLIVCIGSLPGPWSEVCPECICTAEETRKKASSKQALYCQKTDSSEFLIFKGTQIFCLWRLDLKTILHSFFSLLLFVLLFTQGDSPLLCSLERLLNKKNKSLGPPEGIRGPRCALGEPPMPGPSIAGGPSVAWQYSSVKTKHSAEGKPLKITPTTVEIKLLCQEEKWGPQIVPKDIGWKNTDILGLFSPQCRLFLSCFMWFFCTLEWSV